MRRSITAPVRVATENEFRALAHVRSRSTGHFVGPHMQVARTSEMRSTIGLLLSQIPRPRGTLEDGTPNRYHVTLTRISPGVTDGDGLQGGTMKAVRDAVAEWIGIDDGHARIRWSYEQQGCPLRMFALRIDVEDLEPGRDVVIERGNLPTRITAARQRGSDEPRAPKPAPAAQTELVFREVYAVLPHEQDGGDPVLTPLAMKGDAAPEKIRVRLPAAVFGGASQVRFAAGAEVTLERALGRVDGKEAWIYSLPDEAAGTSGATNSRRTR